LINTNTTNRIKPPQPQQASAANGLPNGSEIIIPDTFNLNEVSSDPQAQAELQEQQREVNSQIVRVPIEVQQKEAAYQDYLDQQGRMTEVDPETPAETELEENGVSFDQSTIDKWGKGFKGAGSMFVSTKNIVGKLGGDLFAKAGSIGSNIPKEGNALATNAVLGGAALGGISAITDGLEFVKGMAGIKDTPNKLYMGLSALVKGAVAGNVAVKAASGEKLDAKETAFSVAGIGALTLLQKSVNYTGIFGRNIFGGDIIRSVNDGFNWILGGGNPNEGGAEAEPAG
jgi:hypothetical protein